MGRGLGASSCFPKTARERVLQDRAGCHHCSGRRGEDDPVSRSIALHPRCLAADAGRTCCPTPETTHSQWQQGFPGLQNSQSRQQGDCFFFFFLHTAVAILPCLCLKPTLHPSLTQLSGAHLCCLHSAASQQPSFQSLQENGPPASPAGYSIASAFTFKNSVS